MTFLNPLIPTPPKSVCFFLLQLCVCFPQITRLAETGTLPFWFYVFPFLSFALKKKGFELFVRLR